MIQIDMDMPKNCQECRFLFDTLYDGKTYYCCYAMGLPLPEEAVTGRPNDCPLEEVKHNECDAYKGCKVGKNGIKGKWIFDQELNVLTQTGEFMSIYHCSECGNKIKTVESYLSKNHCFCGVCGADMRGEEE